MDIKKNNINNTKFWAGLLLAQILFFYLLSKSAFVLKWHFYFFEIQKNIHQKTFAWFTFSFGDILYLLLGIWMIFLLIKSIKNSKLAWNSLFLTFNVFYFIYQLFWGLLYFQTPIIFKLPNEKLNLEETKALTISYLEKCNIERENVKEDKNGIFQIQNIPSIEGNILLQQNKLDKTLICTTPVYIKSIKPSLFSFVMNYTGILGYYNPFTAEAQYNKNMPDTQLPFTMAHESAHQLGIAREEEANFVGFLIGKNTGNKELRYSTNYFVLKNLLHYLSDKDPEFVKYILNKFSNAVKRDLQAERNFYKKYMGTTSDFFETTNDLFLKSNQQDGSINYSYFIELLLRYEKKELRFTTQFQKYK